MQRRKALLQIENILILLMLSGRGGGRQRESRRKTTVKRKKIWWRNREGKAVAKYQEPHVNMSGLCNTHTHTYALFQILR